MAREGEEILYCEKCCKLIEIGEAELHGGLCRVCWNVEQEGE